MVSSMSATESKQQLGSVSGTLVAKYKSSKVVIPRIADYQVCAIPLLYGHIVTDALKGTVSLLQRLIPALVSVPTADITLHTTMIHGHADHVLVSEGAWSSVVGQDHVHSILIQVYTKEYWCASKLLLRSHL